MLRDKKKKSTKKVIKHYQRMLKLDDYRITSRFKTVGEDRDLKNQYAVVEIDNKNKTIYVKLNSIEWARMKGREMKRFILHELLHSFFWELSNLFDEVVINTRISLRKQGGYIRKFEEIEHRKINHLVRILSKLDKYKVILKSK